MTWPHDAIKVGNMQMQFISICHDDFEVRRIFVK